MRRPALALAALAALTLAAFADGPADNAAEKVRPIPPKGIAVPDAERAAISEGLAELAADVKKLRETLTGDALELLPDVEVFHKAVSDALTYNEFYKPAEFAAAKTQLKLGRQRAKELLDGKPSWPGATGLVVRGYRSRVDDSVQPYGLVIPADFKNDFPTRLDVWWHGRGETLTEVEFIRQRLSSPGEFAPFNAIVLHPYGRYCNGSKFAGETDTFECLAAVKKHYKIDVNRILARGFSLGGAACWHTAAHHPTVWAAAAPGAGFSETPEFLNVFQNEKLTPTWYEQKLWRLYNATDYAANFANVPTVAYSGEIDKQKQAAEAMAKAMKAEGLELTHLIGPKTAHSYEKGAKADLNKRIDRLAILARKPVPETIKFTTFTLRYPKSYWLEAEGLGRHWERARLNGAWEPGKMSITTENVTRFRVDFPAVLASATLTVEVDGQKFGYPRLPAGQKPSFARTGGKWALTADQPAGLVKKPGLQGPIDDAFYDRFVIVRPTGKPLLPQSDGWVKAEMARATEQWRKQFRGVPLQADDAALTVEQIAASHLVLWGDPDSNAVLKRIVDKLPLRYTAAGVEFGGVTYPPTCVPVMVFPNPLNPEKYVVLNSGFTFREYDQLNNARQVPKLPDYAIVDTATPPTARSPGKVVRAGLFDESWKLQADDGRGDAK